MSYPISISSCFDYNIPLEEQMKHISKAGFRYISLGSNLEHSKLFEDARAEQIKNALDENDLRIDTIHFSQCLTGDNWQSVMKRTMLIAKKLNCSVIVVHCTSFMGKEIKSEDDINMLSSSVTELEMMCEKYGVKVALENLCPGMATDVLEKMLEITNPEYIGFCYDSSHDQIDGPRAMSLLEKWKHRLITVHISDRIKPFTDHVTIGEGFINFDEFAEIINTIDFDFPLLMEVAKTNSQYQDTDEILKNAYSGAYRIMQKVKEQS